MSRSAWAWFRARVAARRCDESSELASAARPAVCVPDAETAEDLALIADGLRAADREGLHVAVRCAPAFVGDLGWEHGGRARPVADRQNPRHLRFMGAIVQ